MNRTVLKKRSHYHDDEFEQENPIKILEESIYRLGNKSGQLSNTEEIDQLAQNILKEFGRFPDAVLSALVACLLELPHKTAHYAVLVGILNANKPEIVEKLMDRMTEYFTDLNQKAWWHLFQLPRVLVEFANCNVITSTSLDTFLLSSCGLIGTSASGESLALSLILAIPLISTELAAKLPNLPQVIDYLGALVNSSDRYSVKRKNINLTVAGLSDEKDFLSTVFDSLKQCREQGFAFVGKLSLYKSFEGLLFDEKNKPLEFNFELSADNLNSVKFESFEPLRIFNDSVTHEAAGTFAQYQQEFIYNVLVDVYELNHRRAAEIIFASFPEELGAPDKSIAQVLFGKLLFASNQEQVAYYEVLLIDSCRLSRLFPPALARTLFKLVSVMDEAQVDLTVISRLAAWFAHHLSHYDFKWNWSEWEVLANSNELSLKRVFLRTLVYRLLLLTYHEKVQSVLPEYMLSLLPSPDNTPTSAYSEDPRFQELFEMLRKKTPSDELISHIKSASIPIEIVIESILQLGSKTFSHLLNAIERYLPVLQSFVQIDDFQTQSILINTAAGFWINSVQNFHIVLEKLMHYRILAPVSVIDWIFSHLAQVITTGPMDSSTFEVEVLLKTASSELILTALRKVPDSRDRVLLASTVFDRLGQLAKLENVDVCVRPLLPWLIHSLTRSLCLFFFSVYDALAAKREILAQWITSKGQFYDPQFIQLIQNTAETL